MYSTPDPLATKRQRTHSINATSMESRRSNSKLSVVAIRSTRGSSRRKSHLTANKNGAENGSDGAEAVTSHAPPRRRRQCRVTVDVSACRYAIIRHCLRERDFRLLKKKQPDGHSALLPAKWDIWWSDRGDMLQSLPRLSPFQKINHFPSMEEICRKDFLANNLNAIYKILPSDFQFFPRSFLIPAESVELRAAMESGPRNATYIVKPRTLCQGKGITLIQSFPDLVSNEPCVVQRYIDNPLLIDGFKFDLRIYVLVHSVNPMRIYVFRNGLARFCTTPFQKPTKRNLNKKRMHLTNYAINKKSKDFLQATPTTGDSHASKRSLVSIMKYLDDSGRYSSAEVWDQICDIVVKTLLCVEHKLQSSYKSYFGSRDTGEAQWGPKCFEILGFDIMLDIEGKAWLFEVNHAPSFAGDSPLDREIKTALISSTLQLIGVTNEKKLQYVRKQRLEWSKRLWSVSTTPPVGRGSSDNVEDTRLSREPELRENANLTSESSSSQTDDDFRPLPTDPGALLDVPDDSQRYQKPSLKNVLLKRNRVSPASNNVSDRSDFSNDFTLVYPLVDTVDGSEKIALKSECFERVRIAAQVNKSKLWS